MTNENNLGEKSASEIRAADVEYDLEDRLVFLISLTSGISLDQVYSKSYVKAAMIVLAYFSGSLSKRPK